MKINIIGRQMNVYEDTKKLIYTKLEKLDKYFKSEAEAQVTLSRKRNTSTLELTVNNDGTIFRCEIGADSFREALDRSIDTMERQIRKNKTKLARKLREGAFDDIGAYDGYYFEEDMEEDEDIIIRTKKFEFRPMSPEEAVMQMNLLDHEFYVFNDIASGDTCVVYRRHDGTYGLIEPEK
ncbi:MAG: ribosome-associated translation inhibitor RaiA [Ruminococcaceae bacterium]|nr:ribosome-associated translation inhibitor RaiA [Oscillospiraceae bacterium]